MHILLFKEEKNIDQRRKFKFMKIDTSVLLLLVIYLYRCIISITVFKLFLGFPPATKLKVINIKWKDKRKMSYLKKRK